MPLYKKNTPIAIAKGHFMKATKIADALATGMFTKRHLMARHTNATKMIPIIMTYQLKPNNKTGTIGWLMKAGNAFHSMALSLAQAAFSSNECSEGVHSKDIHVVHFKPNFKANYSNGPGVYPYYQFVIVIYTDPRN